MPGLMRNFSGHVFLGEKQAPQLGTLRRGAMAFFVWTCFCGKAKAPARNATPRHNGFYKNMSKMGPEKICLRFWDILGCQVQNDLKTLGNRFLGSDPNFLKKCEK